MKDVRSIATILYYCTRIGAGLFFLTAAYAFLILALSLYTNLQGLPISIQNNNSFLIFYPFTRVPFLAGDHTTSYLITSTATVALYGFFLWLLSAVFKAFKQHKLFISKSVVRLERFYVFNLSVPLICLVLLVILGHQIRDALIIVFLHLMIGVFAFFMAAIFKQGLLLQEEQDLTL